MKSLEVSVVEAMDGSDPELFLFLPYILQDLWEMGADPERIIKLITKHFSGYNSLTILDLGCGKGPVLIKAALRLGCRCHGIDANPAFIKEAHQKAKAYKVEHLCRFETADMREKVKDLGRYSIIVLGAIGPVFGDYYKTLTILSKCLQKSGAFIIDDAYIKDQSDYTHPLMFKRKDVLKQIDLAGMRIVKELPIKNKDVKDSNKFIYRHVRKRCKELVKKYPTKRSLFEDYIKKQKEENAVLESKALCMTMLVKQK